MDATKPPIRSVLISNDELNDQKLLNTVLILSHHMIRCGLKDTTIPRKENDGKFEMQVRTNMRLETFETMLGIWFTALITKENDLPIALVYFVKLIPEGSMSFSGKWIRKNSSEFFESIKSAANN